MNVTFQVSVANGHTTLKAPVLVRSPSGPVSTWMGDRLGGTPGCSVGIQFFSSFFSPPTNLRWVRHGSQRHDDFVVVVVNRCFQRGMATVGDSSLRLM